MVRNDDALDPDDVMNCFVAQVKDLYDIGIVLFAVIFIPYFISDLNNDCVNLAYPCTVVIFYMIHA